MNDFTNFSSSKSNAELGSEIILKKTSGSIGVALEILGVHFWSGGKLLGIILVRLKQAYSEN